MDCVCCYEKSEIYIKCECGVVSCGDCLSLGTEVAISEIKKLFCFGGCGKETSPDILTTVGVFHSVLDRYNDVCMSIDMAKLGISKREEDVIDDETLNLVIRCCGVIFMRGDACNKVSCPICHTKYCWVCKDIIKGYEHFDIGKCELYGEREVVLANIERKIAFMLSSFWEKIFDFLDRVKNNKTTFTPQAPRIVDYELLVEPIRYLMTSLKEMIKIKDDEYEERMQKKSMRWKTLTLTIIMLL